MTDETPRPSEDPAPTPSSAPDPNPTLSESDSTSIDQELLAAIGDPARDDSPTPDSVSASPAASTKEPASLESEIAAALAGVDLMALANESTPATGTRINLAGGRRTRTGQIVSIRKGSVLVEFGPKKQGVCPLLQFKEPPTEGSTAEFLVERLDSEGLYVLSVPGSVQKADWGNMDIGQTVEGKVIGVNKGGLEVEVAHHTGFMPAGQIDIRHIPDISIMLNERVTCRVTQLDKRKGRLVLSRRVIIEEERAKNRDAILATLEPGQRKTVVVTSIQPYGVFADLGGIDGLIHVSEISHDRVRDPGDHVKVGEELEVMVTKIDTSGDQPKIGLSRKAVVANSRSAIGNALEVGATVSGTVRKIADFGAFVEVAEGIEGLLHISEISHKRIDRIEGVLREGEVLQVKILSIDSDKGRVSLSKKALEERPAGADRGKGRDSREPDRPEDPEMRKLRAQFSGDLKGGLG
ncbi:MAG: S1 RNA-binding domain-containing protein [Phycisphaerales bacterium]|nr:S1 RNA-binding domain-containing protein [Phycisphaerales bacterium]